MVLRTCRLGTITDALQWDDGDYDSAIETNQPIKAGAPVDPEDVVILSEFTESPGEIVSSSAVIADHAVVRGDGGVREVQDTGILVDDSDNIALPGDLSFTGTARIAWTKITANGVTLGDGPPTSSDTVSDLQTAHDGNTYEVAEIAANAGQNLIVDFTGVTAFNWVQILARVKETAGHVLTVQLEITPFDDSAWHTYHVMKDQPADQNFENYSFFVPDDAAYINSGVVKVRFIHEMAGNASDDWYFDCVALYQ